MSLDEVSIIETINKIRQKSPEQLNREFECDAEIIRVGNQMIAITTDTLSEEISLGTLKSMYSFGWIATLMSISDIAAAGAKPLGVLLNLNIPDTLSENDLKAVYSGVEDCCRQHETFVLGGDTNSATELLIGTSCIGLCVNGQYNTRFSYSPEDRIYVADSIGLGNLVALLNINKAEIAATVEKSYLSQCSVELGQIINEYKGSCIDNSDGLLLSLFQLYKGTQYGFDISFDKVPYSEQVQQAASTYNLPLSIFSIGKIGDYGLIFTIPKEKDEQFKQKVNPLKLNINCIGQVINDNKFQLNYKNNQHEINPKKLEHRLNQINQPEKYIKVALDIITEFNLG